MGKNDLQAIKKPEKTILPNNKPGRKRKILMKKKVN